MAVVAEEANNNISIRLSKEDTFLNLINSIL